MINVGIVGLGNMGRMFYKNLAGLDDVNIAAVCEANPNIVEDSKKSAGNIEGIADEIDFDSFKLYSDYDEFLKEVDVEGIFITLPTFLHKDFTVKALEAGYNVFCEKPMALTIDDCEAMIAARQASGTSLQIGHCIRFWPEYAKTKERIDSGEYGKVLAASFSRLSFPPSWSADSWFMDETKSGGVGYDLHIHDTDYIHYLFGMPASVSSTGVNGPWGGLGQISTRYDFGNEMSIEADGSWIMSDSFGFEMSFKIVMEKATIIYDCTRQPAFQVCPSGGEKFTPEVAEGDGYLQEINHFISVIGGEEVPAVITPEQSRDSIKIINAELESIKTGERVAL